MPAAKSGIKIDGTIGLDGRGTILELYRAVPVPERNVPFEDILNFKAKRRDEVVRLSVAMREMFSGIDRVGDQVFELKRRQDEIDQTCKDLIEVSRESALPFRLSNWQVSFSFERSLLLPAALAGFGVLDAVQTIVAGALMSVSTGVSLTEDKKKTPFSYAVSIENDLL